MDSASDNERGFWESIVVQILNDEILESLGCVWIDWKTIDSDWYFSRAAIEFRARAQDAIRTEFGDSHLFVLKDPLAQVHAAPVPRVNPPQFLPQLGGKVQCWT